MRPSYTTFNYSGSSAFSIVVQFALSSIISPGCQALQYKGKHFLQFFPSQASQSFVPAPRQSCFLPFISSEQKARTSPKHVVISECICIGWPPLQKIPTFVVTGLFPQTICIETIKGKGNECLTRCMRPDPAEFLRMRIKLLSTFSHWLELTFY